MEKLKKLDKKVIIGIVAAVLVVIIAVVGVVIATSNKPANADDNSKPNNEYVAGNENDATDDSSSSSTSEEVSSSEESSSSEEDSSSSNEDAQNGKEDKTNGNSNSNSGKGDTTTAVQKPTATNPEGEEILGAGSKDQPYLEYPGDDYAVKTAKVPAGKALYYDIYRVGGMYLTINDADAYVICEGTKYTAKNGKVSFKVPNALASDAVSFQIGNNGSSAKSFTIKFANLQGSFANPEKIKKLGDFDKSLAAGVETGYYYKYNAEKAGTIRFYIVEESKDSILVVTNNRNSAQRTTEADVLTDDKGNEYIEVEVKKGDELIINVGAMPNKRGKYPAIEITWRGEYE